jgi:beta-galactosidase
MTRLTVRVTDPYGNPLPYAFKVINCELEGPAELIGENPLLLVGGQAALYIKAGQKTGRISIRAKALDLPDSEVGLDIIEPVQKQDQPSC